MSEYLEPGDPGWDDLDEGDLEPDGAGFHLLTTFADELFDHYCVPGDEPCETREPAGEVFEGPTPRDAAWQCRTCAWAAHCLASSTGLFVDVEEVDEDEYDDWSDDDWSDDG